MKKTIIIVGSNGQDGRLLKTSLEASGFNIIGISRKEISKTLENTPERNPHFDITRPNLVNKLIKEVQPSEVYYLAAHHVSAQEDADDSNLEVYNQYHQVHVAGLVNFLNGIRIHAPNCKLFYAASSLVFDGTLGPRQDENTPLSPVGFYGLTKAQGIMLCREFRNTHNIFASVGILYNHESILRNNNFLSMKLISAAKKISLGIKAELTVGDLSAEADWGYAPDFIRAFKLVLSIREPGDFIIATGESHTVAEFAEIIFRNFGLNYLEYIQENSRLLYRKVPRKIGDIKKIQTHTGWKPSLDFQSFVRKLVDDYANHYHDI